MKDIIIKTIILLLKTMKKAFCLSESTFFLYFVVVRFIAEKLGR